MIEIFFDTREVDRLLDSLTMKALSRSVSRSLNEAARSTREESVKRIRDIKTLKNPRRRIELFKSNPSFLAATLKIADYGSPLYDFKPRRRIVQTAKGKRIGVTVEVNKGRRVLVKGGFFAETKHRVGIFRRQGRSRNRITHLLTSSVYDIFKFTKFAEEIQRFAQSRFDARFNENLKYYFHEL